MFVQPPRAPAAVAGPAMSRGFTLVELLVVVAILGTLIGISLPAVQRVREAARRTHCQANLKAMGVGLTAFEGARRWFPPGDDALSQRYHAWSSFILPFLDEDVVAKKIDYAKAWNAPGGNDVISDLTLPIYVCPAGIVQFAGKQDYGGILGTAVPPSGQAARHPDWDHSGVLYATDQNHRQPTRVAMITDGLSRTLVVSEGVDRGIEDTDTDSRIGNSRWSCGTNCFLHNSRVLNTPDVDGFRSNHLGGVGGLFADGRVQFFTEEIHPDVVIAMCTKDGREALGPDGS